MAKGGDSTSTTTYTMSPEQRQLYQLAIPGVQQFAATVPQRYQGSTVAPFDPSQIAGQESALGAASGPQTTLAQQGAAQNQFLSGDIWNPASNPNLQGAIDAAVRPITQNYQQVVRPAIRDEATSAGQIFGGSRRNIAEGVAGGQYLNSVGDTASKLVQNQYQTNLDAYVKALGLLPQTQQAQVTPALTTSGVGDVRQNLAQQLLGQNVSNFNYDQLAPFLQSQDILSLLQGIPGGTSTTTGNAPQGNTALSALGGAAAGASLGSAILPGAGTGVGAGLGALLAFLK